jgi:hypothetical protein
LSPSSVFPKKLGEIKIDYLFLGGEKKEEERKEKEEEKPQKH